MDNLDNEVLDEFRNIIRQIIKEEFEKYINKTNLELYYDGIVDFVSGDYAIVKLDFQTTELIKNNTGKALAKGNKVRVYSGTSTLVGAYIGVQLDTYEVTA